MALQRFKARAGFNANAQRSVLVGDPLPWNDVAGAQDFIPRDWMLAHANYVQTVGRIGNLPDPTNPAKPIRPGSAYLIKYDYRGETLDRLVVWDDQLTSTGGIASITAQVDPADAATIAAGSGTGYPGEVFQGGNNDGVFTVTYKADGSLDVQVTTPGTGYFVGETYEHNGLANLTNKVIFTVQTLSGASAHGGWRFVDHQSWVKGQVADPLQGTDQNEGDLTSVTENDKKELWVYQNNAWIKLFGEVEIKGWIASLSLFEGVVQEVGGTTPNAPDFSKLPDLAVLTAANDLSKIAHYWTFTGTANYTVQPTDPIIGTDLNGSILNPGDWIQVANLGTAAVPDLHYVTVGGDLLSRARGDALFGLNPWVDGSWEADSLVVHNNNIYKANQGVLAGDLAPGVAAVLPAVNPWTKVDLSAGIRWVTDDVSLPVTGAPAGEVWFVVSSARAGGAGALYYWDPVKNSWQPLTGGGLALALGGGQVIYERPLKYDSTAGGTKPAGKYEGDLLFMPEEKIVQRWEGSPGAWATVLKAPDTLNELVRHEIDAPVNTNPDSAGRKQILSHTVPNLKQGVMYEFVYKAKVGQFDSDGGAVGGWQCNSPNCTFDKIGLAEQDHTDWTHYFRSANENIFVRYKHYNTNSVPVMNFRWSGKFTPKADGNVALNFYYDNVSGWNNKYPRTIHHQGLIVREIGGTNITALPE